MGKPQTKHVSPHSGYSKYANYHGSNTAEGLYLTSGKAYWKTHHVVTHTLWTRPEANMATNKHKITARETMLCCDPLKNTRWDGWSKMWYTYGYWYTLMVLIENPLMLFG